MQFADVACALKTQTAIIFGIAERLRTLRYPIFTGGVVMASGICSACFLRKRRRCGEQPRPLRLLTTFASTSPKGRGLGKEMKFAWTAKGSPFEERLPPLRGKMSPQVTKGGIWQSRQALTERARTLRDQREQTEGVFPGYQLYTRAVNCTAMP